MIQKFSQIMSKGGRSAKSWPRVACSEVDQEPFAAMIGEYAKERSNAIFSDGVVYAHCERSKLLWLLEEHVSNNLIKVGKDFCKQRVGIAQGSSLSTLLCCYYLARMEKERGLIDHGDSHTLLMRYTDDFLFVSTSQAKAKHFYETLKQGDPAFNVCIAVDKSLHNLEVGVADECSRLNGARRNFPWCSYLINMDTLSTEYDMTRYAHAHLADTLTIQSKRPFETFAKVMQTTIKNRSLAIFLDVDFNGLDVVVGNLYQSFLLAALKLLSAVRQIKRRFGQRTSHRHLHNTILTTVDICYTSVRAKMRRAADGRPWPIDRAAFRLLAFHAFARIFALRPSSRRWLDPLRKEMEALQPAHHDQDERIRQAWARCADVIASITL